MINNSFVDKYRSQIEALDQIISSSKSILIIQADNPDADSLGSVLAINHILTQMGKDTYLYGGVETPSYLKYIQGWAEINSELPNMNSFDLAIIVDASTKLLLDSIYSSPARSNFINLPKVILDHHNDSALDISNSSVIINDSKSVSTGELLYKIGSALSWEMSLPTLELLAITILSDSLGLSTPNTTASTYRVMAELIDRGVDRPKLENERRLLNKMAEKIFRYKAELIKRTDIIINKIAIVIIPDEEIKTYSPLYNPAPLIQPDHLQIDGIEISIVLKSYSSGRVTGAIRTNSTSPVASTIATSLGGGGHKCAAGFRIENVKSVDDVKMSVLKKATELISDKL